MGKKKVKNSKREVKIWICCNCQKRDVDVVQYTTDGPRTSNFAEVDTEDDDLVE